MDMVSPSVETLPLVVGEIDRMSERVRVFSIMRKIYSKVFEPSEFLEKRMCLSKTERGIWIVGQMTLKGK